jgi:hypothetical protein
MRNAGYGRMFDLGQRILPVQLDETAAAGPIDAMVAQTPFSRGNGGREC